MIPKTIGVKYDTGKVAQIQCIKNDTLDDLDIKDKCFLLIMIYEGEARFEIGTRQITAQAPCFVCFDESENPKLLKKKDLVCNSMYFHPKFFNVNLTFEHTRNRDFRQAAHAHDLFLMQPFTDSNNFVFLIFDEYIQTTKRLFDSLINELGNHCDWYWSCRSRTYFIQLIFMLEQVYGFINKDPQIEHSGTVGNSYLQKAVTYIEGHYSESITLSDIANSIPINQASLIKLFKSEFGMTAMEYLWKYRITVAKKQLQFTSLPIGEISSLCGFKTVQHFCRKFEEITGMTPGDFRTDAQSRRKKGLNDF